MHHLLRRISLCTFLASATALHANVKLPAIISDHMVLQSSEDAAIWGWADPDEKVTVSIAGQTKEATPGANGKWMVKLDKLAASKQPTTLTVAGKNNITVNDVLIGEVWLCSGQSNMALRVQGTLGSEEEIAKANNPMVRMFFVRSDGNPVEQENCVGTWSLVTPETLGNFAATAYYFGKTLNKALDVPVGLINSSVGGTRIEAWTSAEAQRNTPALQERVAEYDKEAATFDPAKATAKYEKDLAAWKVQSEADKAAGKVPARAPFEPLAARNKQGRGLGFLFNAKIAPLIPYTIKGAIWYQGEANSSPDRAPLYREQLPLLVKDWRTRWGYDFPFGWVQLTNFDGGEGRDWPLMRENQLKTLQVKNTGMAITIDVGDKNNIHALNKPEVGRRMALWALGDVYEQKIPTSSGPLPAGHKTQGSEIVVSFTHTDGGLVAKDGGELKGFVIAGEDKQWKPATAKIVNDTVVISSPEVKQPAAARYAWANFPEVSLYNSGGLPASPFRTDDWVDPVAVISKAKAYPSEGDAAGEGESAPVATKPAAKAAATPAPAPAQAATSTAVVEGVNLVKNGDFAQPVNTSKKRGEWVLSMAAEKGSASAYNMAPEGFKTADGTLEMDMGALNPSGLSKMNAVTLDQFILSLAPGKKYQFSFEAHGTEAGTVIQCGVGVTTNALGDTDGGLARQKVTLGTDFQRYTYDFEATPTTPQSPDPQKFTRVNIRLGEAHGTVSIRDIRLIEVN